MILAAMTTIGRKSTTLAVPFARCISRRAVILKRERPLVGEYWTAVRLRAASREASKPITSSPSTNESMWQQPR